MRVRITLLVIALVTLSQLHCSCQTALVRGPYLQAGTSHEVTIRWRTSLPSNGFVMIGSKPGHFSRIVASNDETINHEITVDSLVADTKYYYAVGANTEILQGDEDNYFTTYPLREQHRKLRFWIAGDCGNNSENQRQVRDQYLEYVGNGLTDGWLLLGDNAYENGKDDEYQSGFFNQYQDNIMKRTVLWPAIGNHDYGNNPVLQDSKVIPYYDIFTIPSQGECGGVASHSESYYSFTIGNIHFIALDSYGRESMKYRLYDTLSPQIGWLKKDLEANQSLWVVAYWHHPPYTKGSHDSDTESELILIRQNVLRILERYNVDLVLCGHSHAYERTRIINGHYDFSEKFFSGNVKDSSSACYDGSFNSCPYLKHSDRKDEGVVYVVAGSAGKVGGNTIGFPHPAMAYSNRTVGGSLIMEVEENRLDMKWLTSEGRVEDKFTIMKDVNKHFKRSIESGMSLDLTASWIGNYRWNDLSTSRTIKVAPKKDTVYIVEDSAHCLQDSVSVEVEHITAVQDELNKDQVIWVYPNPAINNVTIKVFDDDFQSATLYDFFGNEIATKSFPNCDGARSIEFGSDELSLTSGVYYIKVRKPKKTLTKKFVFK